MAVRRTIFSNVKVVEFTIAPLVFLFEKLFELNKEFNISGRIVEFATSQYEKITKLFNRTAVSVGILEKETKKYVLAQGELKKLTKEVDDAQDAGLRTLNDYTKKIQELTKELRKTNL